MDKRFDKRVRKKVLMFCSNFDGSSCDIMGKNIARSLSRYYDVRYVRNVHKMPFQLHFLASIPLYVFKSLQHKSDVTISLKPFPAPCLAAMIQKVRGAKIVLDIDDIDYGYSSKLSRVLKYAQSLFVDRFDLVMAHNPYLLEKVKQEFNIRKARLALRGQGVDIGIFKVKKVSEVKDGKKRLVFVGFLNSSCYLDDILAAMKLASQKCSNIRLAVIGDGYKRAYYEKRAKDLGLDVEFLGNINDQNVIADCVNSSDASIIYYPDNLSNRYRASMKIREYLAVGKPTICNDLGDLAQFKDYTYHSATGDLEGLSGQIIKALFSPDKRGDRGREYVRKDLSWDAVVEKIAKEIEDA